MAEPSQYLRAIEAKQVQQRQKEEKLETARHEASDLRLIFLQILSHCVGNEQKLVSQLPKSIKLERN
jgi:hypothetical protein